MKQRIGWLILLDVGFAVLGYILLYFKWYLGLQYCFGGVGLLVLLGPVFVVANYGILFSELGLLSLIFSVGCYALLFHSHKMFLKRYENGFYVLYVMISWFLYLLSISFFNYFGWFYRDRIDGL